MTDDLYAYLEQLFEWDRMKAARNVIAHGVRFPEAASVFFDELAIFELDPDHSDNENAMLSLVLRSDQRYSWWCMCYEAKGFA